MTEFFINVTPSRRKNGADVYHVCERFKDESNPFEQTRKVATCVDKEAAALLQCFFDEASALRQRSLRGHAVSQRPEVAFSEQHGALEAHMAAERGGTQNLKAAPETSQVLQPTEVGIGNAAVGVVRTKNKTKKKRPPGKRPVFKGKDIPAAARESEKRKEMDGQATA
jgi:hypothetical protein